MGLIGWGGKFTCTTDVKWKLSEHHKRGYPPIQKGNCLQKNEGNKREKNNKFCNSLWLVAIVLYVYASDVDFCCVLIILIVHVGWTNVCVMWIDIDEVVIFDILMAIFWMERSKVRGIDFLPTNESNCLSFCCLFYLTVQWSIVRCAFVGNFSYYWSVIWLFW